MNFAIVLIVIITGVKTRPPDVEVPSNSSVNLFYKDVNRQCCVDRFEASKTSQRKSLISYEGTPNRFGTFQFRGYVLSKHEEGEKNDDICNQSVSILFTAMQSKTKYAHQLDPVSWTPKDNRRFYSSYSPQNLSEINFCQYLEVTTHIKFPPCETECRIWMYDPDGKSRKRWKSKAERINEKEHCTYILGKSKFVNPIFEFLKTMKNESYPNIQVEALNNSKQIIKVDWLQAKNFRCNEMKQTTNGIALINIQAEDGTPFVSTKREINNFNKMTIQEDEEDMTCHNLLLTITVEMSFHCQSEKKCGGKENITFITNFFHKPTIKIPLRQENNIIHFEILEKHYATCENLHFQMTCSDSEWEKEKNNTSIIIKKEDGWKVRAKKISKIFPNCKSFQARAYIDSANKSYKLDMENWQEFGLSFQHDDWILKLVVPIMSSIFFLSILTSGCCLVNPCKKRKARENIGMTNKIANFEKNDNIIRNMTNHNEKNLKREFETVYKKKTKDTETLVDIYGYLPIKAPRNNGIYSFWNKILDLDIKTVVMLPTASREQDEHNKDPIKKWLPDRNDPEIHLEEGIKIKLQVLRKQNKNLRSNLNTFARSIRIKERTSKAETVYNSVVTVENQKTQKTLKILRVENTDTKTLLNLNKILNSKTKSIAGTEPIGIIGDAGVGAFIALSKLTKDYRDTTVDQVKVYDTVREINKKTTQGIHSEQEYKDVIETTRSFVEGEVSQYGHAKPPKDADSPKTSYEKCKGVVAFLFDFICSLWTVADVILDVRTMLSYYAEWQAGILSRYFFVFSVSAMILPTVSMIVLLWTYLWFGVRRPTSHNYKVAIFLTFLVPLMWPVMPFMFSAVAFYDCVNAVSQRNLNTSRPFKRFILIVMAMKCSEQCFEGFPQFLLSVVYLITNGINEDTTITLVSCIFSAGSLFFFLFLNLYKSVFSYERSLCGVLEQTLTRAHN